MKSEYMKQQSVMCGILHNLFSKEPETSWITQFQQEQVFEHWPRVNSESEDAANAMAEALSFNSVSELLRDYNRLFILAPKRAYPWGSVYTDINHLLHGETTRQWERFLLNEKVEVSTPGNDPLDHVGIFLAVLSHLLEQGDERKEQIKELLSTHLLPWSYQFCHSVSDGAKTDFYRNAGLLLKGTLKHLQTELNVAPEKIPLFS